MALTIKLVCGSVVVLALTLALLRNYHNSRPTLANSEERAPQWAPGLLGRLINAGALISILLLLLPLDQLLIA